MEQILLILPILVGLVFAWFLYLNINLVYTISKAKKKDPSLKLCLSQTGAITYIILIGIYIFAVVAGSSYVAMNLNDNFDTALFVLNISVILTMILSYLFQQVILIGNRQIMIGRVTLDYRKIKRVAYPKDSKLQFTYGQKSFQTSLLFADRFEIKRILKKYN